MPLAYPMKPRGHDSSEENRAVYAVRAAVGDHVVDHMSTTKSSWCVLEAELEDQATSVSIRGIVLEPLAPRTERQVAKVWMALEPVSDHLPEVLLAKLQHLHRSVLPQL